MAFARQGANLVLASRNQEALEAVAAECNGAGARAVVVPTDVTDASAVQALAKAALAQFGHIDIWINNVGVGAVGLFDATPLEAHRRVIESNLMGHMHGAYTVIPHFKARGRGTLINMISLGGWVSAPYAAAYTASKFGLRGFSESLRAELSGLPHVHVCEVYPTFVDTPGMSHGANYSGHRVSPPPPVIDPRRVAKVLVGLARHPRPSVYIGAPALPGILAHALAPNLVGRIMMWLTERSLKQAGPAQPTDGNLFAPSRGNLIDGGFKSSVSRNGVSTGTAAVSLGAIALMVYLIARQRSR